MFKRKTGVGVGQLSFLGRKPWVHWGELFFVFKMYVLYGLIHLCIKWFLKNIPVGKRNLRNHCGSLMKYSISISFCWACFYKTNETIAVKR